MQTQSIHGAIATSLWVKSAIVTRQLDSSLGAVHGIGLSEYMVLFRLSRAPNKSLRRIDIADELARTASGITRLLAPMEKTGLVSKETNERDARVSLVKLTSAGEELFQNATVTLEARAESLLKNFDQKKADNFLKLLNRL